MLSLLFLLFLIPSTSSVICSTFVPLTSQHLNKVHRKTKEVTQLTQLTVSLSLRESACFSITNPDTGRSETYAITLSLVKSIHEYENSYQFSLPRVDVTCLCDCPRGDNFCGPKTNGCSKMEGEGSCVNWYSAGMSNRGCLPFSGAAEVVIQVLDNLVTYDINISPKCLQI